MLGLGAGLVPGPLLGLVIAETLRAGWAAGALVAMAPLVADGPIVAVTFLVLVNAPRRTLALLGLAGGLYAVLLGWEGLRSRGAPASATQGHPASPLRSLARGVAVNLLNPHPYIFWIALGGPLVAGTYRANALLPVACFLGAFYGCLVGTKLVVALLVHRGRASLSGSAYRRALQAAGALLIGLGVYLFAQALRDALLLP